MSEPSGTEAQAATGTQPQAGTTPATTQPQAGVTPATQAEQAQTVESLPQWAQDLLKEVRGEAAGHRKKVADFEKAQKDADDAAAVKQGNFEKLANDRQAEIDRLNGELSKRDRETLIAKVAAAHKLPTDLAELLQGDDEAALTDHAKRLAKHVKPVGAPDTEGGAGSRGGGRPNAGQAAKAQTQTAETPNYSFIPAGAVRIPD